MQQAIQNSRDRVQSYQHMMRLLAWTGILLPLIVVVYRAVALGVIGADVASPVEDPLTSVSKYHYTHARDPFAGTLAILALILYTYRGDTAWQNRWSYIGCVAALGVACCPCQHEWLKWIHFGSAVLLFLVFALFALKFFREAPEGAPSVSPSSRRFHFWCGLGIVAGLVACAILFYINKDSKEEFAALFWLEWFMLLCFGLSWLRKAEESDPYIIKFPDFMKKKIFGDDGSTNQVSH